MATDTQNPDTTTDEKPGIDAATVESDDEPDGEHSDRAESAGRTFGGVINTARLGASKIWTGFLYGASSVMGTDKVWQNRMKKNIKRMYKATDADAIGFVVRKKGDILPTPVKYRPPDIEDEDNPHGLWEAGHMDQTFTAATGANATETINNIPVVWLHTDDWAEASFSGALLAEAVELGNTEPLYQNPTVNVLTLEQPADADAARADGGVKSETRIENATPGALKDEVVDVESVGRHDGTRVRWEKFFDLRMQETTVEEMDQAQERGRLAGLREAMGGADNQHIKWFVLGMVGLGLGAFWLGAKYGGAGGGGGGGGGGGDVMPFMMNAGGLVKSAALGVGWL
jgi:hypothetical protein